MSSAVGWPLGEAAGLVTLDVDDEVAVAGLSLGIDGAFGDGLFPCANETDETNAAVRITMSEI